jgi:hypothetical protein
MAMNMSIGMAVWMRFRGHGWAPVAEMSAAMLVPVTVLIVPFLAGILSGGALLGAINVLMLPAMVIAMYHRRDEYAQDHHRHRPPSPATDLPQDEVVLVLEGDARRGRPAGQEGRVHTVHAEKSGDDAIVEEVMRQVAVADVRGVIVVTADRTLRDRVEAAGANSRSPGWLLDQL